MGQEHPRKRRTNQPGNSRKEMLINAILAEEVRIAIVENGILESLYVERASQESYTGSIYKGKIVNIEPSIQAAFVDFGVGRNGFLHVSDVSPAYYKHITDGQRGHPKHDQVTDLLDLPEVTIDEEALLDSDEPDEPEEPMSGDSEPGYTGHAQEDMDTTHDEEVTGEEAPPAGDGYGRDRERYEPRGRYNDRDRGRGGRGGRSGGGRYGDRDRGDRGGRGGRSGGGGGRGRYNDRPRPPMDPYAKLPPPGTPIDDEPIPQSSQSAPNYDSFGSGIEDFDPWNNNPSNEARDRQDYVDAGAPPHPTDVEQDAEVVHDLQAEEAHSPHPTEVEPLATEERGHWPDFAEPEFTGDVKASFTEAPAEDAAAELPEAEGEEVTDDEDFEEFDDEEDEEEGDEGAPASEFDNFQEDWADVSFSRGEDETPTMPSAERRTEPGFEEPDAEEIPASEMGPRDYPKYDPQPDEEQPQFPGYPSEGPPQRGRYDSRGRGGDRRGPGGRDGRFRGRGGDRFDRGGRGGGGFRRGGPNRRPGGGPREFGRDGPNAPPKPPIQDIFRRGQEVLVQVIKEGIGNKGPTLSTYVSIPGRYLVLMPGMSRIGVSRKIGDDQQRRRLRKILEELQPPEGLGFIIRTAGLDRSKIELQRDLAYLARLWRVIVSRIKKGKSPSTIYQESDIITRTIRDIFANDISSVLVDEPGAFEQAKEFMDFVMPKFANRLALEQNNEPLFHRYNIEQEIAKIQQKRVPLANGGSLVIDQTEALVAIDVNSGQFRQERDAEANAFQMNLAAAREVARQLRLRDLGGVIVIDFIDMRDERHRRAVEIELHKAVERDRARTKVLRMSQFGIIQMTRQRIRPSLKRAAFEDCPTCHGTSQVKTGESMSIEVMRLLHYAAWRESVSRIRLRVSETVAQYLLNRKRKDIAVLEDKGNLQVTIFGAPDVAPETLEIQCYDAEGGEVRLVTPPPVDLKPKRGR